jgi:regulator of sigma D
MKKKQGGEFMMRAEEKAFLCNNRALDGYCHYINHHIMNGHSSIYHCKECKKFEFKKATESLVLR